MVPVLFLFRATVVGVVFVVVFCVTRSAYEDGDFLREGGAAPLCLLF
jgi:hypothetical protein